MTGKGRALGLLLGSLVSSCGGDAGRQALYAELNVQLADDPSGALARARASLHDSGPDAELLLLAAAACLELERRDDALGFAEQGLALERITEEQEAELAWARGSALMGRYRELGMEADWREANISLERATSAGDRRAQAAAMLVLLQDMGGHSDSARQLQFARLMKSIDPGSERTAKILTYLQSRGLAP